MNAIRWWDEESGERVYVHDARDAAELVTAEAEIREMATDDGVLSRAVIGANATDQKRARFLEDSGYKQVFSQVFMELRSLKQLPAARLAPDFNVRSAKFADMRTLWELNNLAYSGRDFVAVATEEGWQMFRDRSDDLSLYTVAEADGGIVAFVSSAIQEDYAEVTEVTVHPGFRRRGLATALLSMNLGLVRDRGIKRVLLHTNGENVSGARSLYDAFGFKEFQTQLRFRKPL